MQFTTGTQNRAEGDANQVDELVRHIARLVRHPGYRRTAVVSVLLLRQLPFDHGYEWQGEGPLRGRLMQAKLDKATLDYLIVSARNELAWLRGPVDA